MPETPKETLRAWLFVHTKTVEKIQSTEADIAANSVGAKRLRSASNPVSVGLSNHRFTPSSRMYAFFLKFSYIFVLNLK